MLTNYDITIPAEEWEDCGDGRLLTTLSVNGSKLHLEAIEVEENAEGYQVHTGVILSDYYNRLCDNFGQDSKWYTVTINGKEYALFASPFCM